MGHEHQFVVVCLATTQPVGLPMTTELDLAVVLQQPDQERQAEKKGKVKGKNEKVSDTEVETENQFFDNPGHPCRKIGWTFL